MKRTLLFTLFIFFYMMVHAQGAMVVTDPTSFAQRLLLATEEMNEQIEQKYKFIEQIKIAQKVYEQSKKTQERVEQVSNYIKSASEVVEIITIGEEIMNLFKNMKKNISNTKKLTDTEKYQCIVDLINCSSNVSNIAQKASSIIKNKSIENDATFSDYERQQELRYLKTAMEETKSELIRIYNNSFAFNLAEEQMQVLQSFINF